MQLLLDTHVVLWALTDDPALPGTARELIMDERNSVWVSAATIWEIGIKHALGRGDMPISAADAVRYCGEAGYLWLDIRPDHAAAVEMMPMIHADPFDRILVAQALCEPMRLVTHDAMMARYGPGILVV